MKKAKTKERMRSKLAARSDLQNPSTSSNSPTISPKKNELEAINANIQDLLKNMTTCKDTPDLANILNSLNLPTARETGNPKKKNKNKKK